MAVIADEDSVLEAEPAGEGNMNVVVRLKNQTSSLILKQSRPFVNKYPQIDAPTNRIDIENEFYQLTLSIPPSRR